MPLEIGKSKQAFSNNVRELEHANKSKSKKRPLAQILAISYAQKRKAERKGV